MFKLMQNVSVKVIFKHLQKCTQQIALSPEAALLWEVQAPGGQQQELSCSDCASLPGPALT